MNQHIERIERVMRMRTNSSQGSTSGGNSSSNTTTTNNNTATSVQGNNSNDMMNRSQSWRDDLMGDYNKN